MKTLNVSEAKTHFSSVVDEVEQGETVLICRRNLPVAKITPVAPDWVSKGKHHTVIGWAKKGPEHAFMRTSPSRFSPCRIGI